MSEQNTPITHGNVDYRFKICKCSECGVVGKCEPFNDFYTLAGNPNGPLFCESCIVCVGLKSEKAKQ